VFQARIHLCAAPFDPWIRGNWVELVLSKGSHDARRKSACQYAWICTWL